MEIYLDANATTPVLAEARAAAMAAMAEDYGNPSSVHGTGLKARALMDAARARARRVLGAPTGQLLFVSGATEGIQTAVLSAMTALRERGRDRAPAPGLLLYGATEHKAVPEAIRHWCEVLQLDMAVLPIPVGTDGRHDLDWLRAHAPRAGLVCTMAVNNETGVISDLDGIAEALRGSAALWLVDSVQALGKVDLRLAQRRIDYAPFSGHKLYAPKGIGLLYVREGAPITPLLAGGGQEAALRSGTENMPGIAALGAVLAALEGGNTFQALPVLEGYRTRLSGALREAFAGIVFNAPAALSLPTTLNFSVPGVGSKLLLDLFDAAEIRVSGGSACSAANAQPSYVLEAMGLPAWRTTSAVRLSFGPAIDDASVEEACRRIRACGEALLLWQSPAQAAPARLQRLALDGACCYVVCDAASRRSVVIDPLPALTPGIVEALRSQGQQLVAVLATQPHRDHLAAAEALRAAMPGASIQAPDTLELGTQALSRLVLPGSEPGTHAYLLRDARGGCVAFVGDALAAPATPTTPALKALAEMVGPQALLLPRHDAEDRIAFTLAGAQDTGKEPATPLALVPSAALALLREHPQARLVDVREPYEQGLGQALGPLPDVGAGVQRQSVPLSGLLDALPDWLALPAETPLLFFCRSGNRSTQAAKALRRLGRANAFSLAGGLALWPRPC